MPYNFAADGFHTHFKETLKQTFFEKSVLNGKRPFCFFDYGQRTLFILGLLKSA